jgi:predicted nucleic acid-binding protein
MGNLEHQYAEEAYGKLNHPVYDCLYLTTAEFHHAPLISADRKFYNCVCEHEVYANHIHWIENPPAVNA